jgi:flavin reductase (DIM6/NTAB) family NADH-FMN oxidoreductase RutF
MQKKIKFPLAKVYSLLESGPVVMIASSLKGRNNVMTMSWLTPLDFDPPLIGCVIGRQSWTSEIIKKTKELTINIPTVEIAKKAVACGNVSGKKVDKFKKFGLTARPASKIKAPLIDECYLSIECKVVDTGMAKKYDMFVVKGVAAWIRPAKGLPKTIHHIGGPNFLIASRKKKLLP